MSRATGQMLQDEVYQILKDKPQGMTAYEINNILNDKERLRKKNEEKYERRNIDGYHPIRLRGNGSGNTTIQLSAKLSRSILFDSRMESKRNPTGQLTPTNIYTARDLEVAYDKMIKSKKKLSKFPKVLQNYAKSKAVEQ
tara:strand:- start:1962 stop:2381 length:420 start_codon:yes stop_codon:yes gene_type:complete